MLLCPCLLNYCTKSEEEPSVWGADQTGGEICLTTLLPEMQNLLNLFTLCVFAVCNIFYNHVISM